MESVFVSSLLQKAGVKHGFLTKRDPEGRQGEPELNIAYGRSQSEKIVDENRQRVIRFFGLSPGHSFFSKQTHSPNVYTVDDLQRSVPEETDALVTALPRVLLAVFTADCIPLLMADPEANVVAAVHASWRTMKQGIIAATVEAMKKKGARRILVSLGPSIHVGHYEVQAEFLGNFPEDRECTLQRGDNLFFDLRKLAVKRLRQAGAEEVDAVEEDTYEKEDLFYSFRRSTERNEPLDGAQASVIVTG